MGEPPDDRSTPSAPVVQEQVMTIVAEALDVPREKVTLHSSLVDDLGAESIDFLDMVFRIETAFGLKIREDEMWEGSIDRTDQASVESSVARLRSRMPDFRWDRLPPHPTEQDLPRLITVQTILDYLQRRGIGTPRDDL